MKVLITGGHFSPAYSLISELKRRGVTIAVAGRRHPFEGDLAESLEYLISKKEKILFYEVRTGRFQRKFTTYTISSLLRTPTGFFRARAILKEFTPDIVVTFGGYIGLPIAYAAAFLGIPVVLHEQTQRAGLASKLIGRVAKKICISFASSAAAFPKEKVVLTGNPIRREIFEVKKKFPVPPLPTIYITGGSTGSHFINLLVLQVLPSLLEEFVVIHQTGESREYEDFENLEKIREKLPTKLRQRYILRKFIFPDELGFIFKTSDLLFSRAGANTVFEIIATRKIALLIPLPHGQNNEQLENAKFIKEQGIGEYIEERDATPEHVLSKIRQMLSDSKKYLEKMEVAASFVIEKAPQKLADAIEEVYDKTPR